MSRYRKRKNEPMNNIPNKRVTNDFEIQKTRTEIDLRTLDLDMIFSGLAEPKKLSLTDISSALVAIKAMVKRDVGPSIDGYLKRIFNFFCIAFVLESRGITSQVDISASDGSYHIYVSKILDGEGYTLEKEFVVFLQTLYGLVTPKIVLIYR